MNLTQVFPPQNRRLIKLITAVNEEQTLLLEHFSGSEALSTLFSFELSLICQDARHELKSLIGQPAHLEIELADGGSYIKIGGGVEIGSQGKVRVHASDHDWVGPKTDSAQVPTFNRDPAAQRLVFHYPGHADDNARMAVDHAYQIKLEDGSTVQGLTDASGLTERVEREAMHQARIAAKRDPKGGSQ